MSKHSPLPWTNHACEGNDYFQRIRDAASEEVGLLAYGPSNKNAPFICEAVNNYDRLQAENTALKAEVENLIWNLAGCSTFALGYGIHDSFAKEKARPAMTDVLKLALKEERYRKALESILTVQATPITDGAGPSDMTNEEKRWLRAMGECVSIATAALSPNPTTEKEAK